MGLRDQKKKQTRKAISDMATVLFLERGYANVTTAEIAERAQVSVPTLFNYFPTKEALVFDDDSESEAKLVAAVANRKKGRGILEALLEMGLESIDSIKADQRKNFTMFMALIDGTPELSSYAKQMWMRHEQALAKAIRKESNTKIGKLESAAIARFVLDSFHRSLGEPNPKSALRVLFDVLRRGWAD